MSDNSNNMKRWVKKEDCECDEEGIIWDKNHKSFYYCAYHSLESQKWDNYEVFRKKITEQQKDIKEIKDKLLKIAKILTPLQS